MQDIKAICFDLDDTLWDLSPVIPRAEQALYDWYQQHYPNVTERFTPEAIRQLRLQMAAEHPHLRHDLTELRMLALRRIAVAAGYAEATAAEAFECFYTQRNRVEVYEDVVPALNRLAGRFRLFSLSNGNADLEAIGIRGHFETVFNARSIGLAKPDVKIFHAVCERIGLPTGQVMHVGDHPENDIVAARKAGLRTAWVNRQGGDWPLQEAPPEHEVACLNELAESLNADEGAV